MFKNKNGDTDDDALNNFNAMFGIHPHPHPHGAHEHREIPHHDHHHHHHEENPHV